MEENSPYRSLSRRQEKNLLKAAEAAARTEFESPGQVGCPDSQTLRLLAHRDPTVDPSADLIDHIATCSPCFNEYSRYRAAQKLRIRISYGLVSVAAIVVLMVIGRSLYSSWSRPAVSQNEIARLPERFTELAIDMRMWGVFRSDAPERQGDRAPLRFPRTMLSLSVSLPVGSEEGTYEVALVDSRGRHLRNATGEAKLKRFVLVLPVKLNLADLTPGLYELWIRRAQTAWNAYPVLLE